MKPLEDAGTALQVNKPLRLKRYEPNRLPDPETPDCLIIINDRHNGVPRGRLALSNGAAWDHVAWLDEIGAPRETVDMMPLVRQAVEAAVAQLPAQEVRVVERHPNHPPALPQSVPSEIGNQIGTVARAAADMGADMLRLQQEIVELKARLEFVERNALARVGVEVA